jgi:ribosomal protein S18 acetylase RimI-like enzyme
MQTDPRAHLRPITIDDLSFLREMIYEAIHWADGERPSMEDTLARPAIGMLTAGWGRDGDWGLVAESPDGAPIGAAWCRSWTTDNHAFGYVADDIPEVSIALARGQREQGLGTTLLTAVIDLARSKGHAKLSLAVEQANLRALHVYEKLGFVRVDTTAEDYIMVLNL